MAVNIVDDHGIPIPEWSQSNLKATSGGHTLKIAGLSHTIAPRRVVILLDVSGSMAGARRSNDSRNHNKWKVAIAAVRALVKTAPSGTQLLFLTFADKIHNPLLIEGQSILQWLDANSDRTSGVVGGPTNLYQAIHEAMDQMKPRQTGDAIYVVTDGEDSRNGISPRRASRDLEEAGIRLFAFRLTESHYATAEDALASEVSDVAFDSGGYQVGLWTRTSFLGPSREQYPYNDTVIAEIESAARVLNTEIADFHMLTIELPEDSGKRVRWKLEAVGPNGKNQNGWTVLYPHVLPPCTAP